jgi:hypothetical protein
MLETENVFELHFIQADRLVLKPGPLEEAAFLNFKRISLCVIILRDDKMTGSWDLLKGVIILETQC